MKRKLAAWISALALLVGLAITTASPAQAAPVEGFDAGNIISDSLFYDGRSMAPNDVQAFLEKRVPRCTIGDAGRQPGAVYGSNRVAKECLRNFSMSTQSKSANAYCAAYAGAANESAAQIITKVGQACGISQKVLLVMLEKEQSLISDSWPFERQLDVAMGYDCPDSGPNYGANCNPAQIGFYNQVYKAAWQLKVYKAHPNNFNYGPNRSNTIQWHPNPNCGTSQVYIENSATAALYIYTPYRPNAAALNAGWGTGDSCSSYGNRNFYSFYTAWFGKTSGPKYPVTGGIEKYWLSPQGAWLGEPHGQALVVTVNGGGRVQTFAKGVVFEPKMGEVSGMTNASPIFLAYTASGGVAASWGWPLSPSVNQGKSGENVMQFQNGLTVEANGAAHLIPTALVTFWNSTGGFVGSLGVPTAAAKSNAGGFTQAFTKNAAVKPAAGSAVVFDLRFFAAWDTLGGLTNAIGLPVGPASEINASGGGQQYPLTGGKMFKSSAGVFTFTTDRMLTSYEQNGGPGGSWGWPTGKPLCSDGGRQCSGTFSNGLATWNQARGNLFTPYIPPTISRLLPGTGESVDGGVIE